MTKLPLSLFLLPSKGSMERENLEQFLSSNASEISTFLPWLSSELLIFAGSSTFLHFIEKEGSKRIPISRIKKYVEVNDRLMRIIVQNANFSDNVDIQSISGFIECLKKYCVCSLVQSKKTSEEIVSFTGVSLRTIQRLNSQKKIYQKESLL